MSQLTREEKLKAFGELTKLPGIQKASVFADERNEARLLIEHPHAYRDWTIMGPAKERGFYRLESSIRIGLDFYEERMTYTRFELCLHESQFERLIQ
jgi:hypothetical protein